MSSAKNTGKITYLKIKTQHYSFNLKLTKLDSPIYDTYYFLVGDKDFLLRACLLNEAYQHLPS